MSASIAKTLNDETVCRAAILIHWFMQSKSGPAAPENEPVTSDRRTAYLWRFCNGASTGNYKASERYHILWGRSILASVCFCFYHRRDELFTAEIYLCILAVQWDGVANSFVGNSQIGIFLAAENISLRGYFGTTKRWTMVVSLYLFSRFLSSSSSFLARVFLCVYLIVQVFI